MRKRQLVLEDEIALVHQQARTLKTSLMKEKKLNEAIQHQKCL
jgi:hypothetical protein